jgi:hypothetical protein
VQGDGAGHGQVARDVVCSRHVSVGATQCVDGSACRCHGLAAYLQPSGHPPEHTGAGTRSSHHLTRSPAPHASGCTQVSQAFGAVASHCVQ